MTSAEDPPLPVPEWPTASDWADLSPLDRAAKYEAVAPSTHAHYLREDATLARHERRLAWANWALRLVGLLLGAAAVIGMVVLSWHAINAGEAQQVKWIIGTPTVLLAGVFVTGRAIGASVLNRSTEAGDGESGAGETERSRRGRSA